MVWFIHIAAHSFIIIRFHQYFIGLITIRFIYVKTIQCVITQRDYCRVSIWLYIFFRLSTVDLSETNTQTVCVYQYYQLVSCRVYFAGRICVTPRSFITFLPINHENDAILSAIVSQNTGVLIVYSAVCSGAEQRNIKVVPHLSLWGWSVNSPHKGPVTRKRSTFDDAIMIMCVWLSSC